MKHLFLTLIISLFALNSYAQETKTEAPKTKQVCKDVIGKDNKPVKNKDGSAKQTCKTIKVHKKLEGTPVPPKK